MTDAPILKKTEGEITRLVFNRLASNNSLSNSLIVELTNEILGCQNDPNTKLICLEGQNGIFCSGLDLQEAIKKENQTQEFGKDYMNLIKTIKASEKVVVSLVDGKVLGGGVGIVVASDYVLATPRSDFNLPEALWGLLPYNVLPFLIQRIGYGKAYMMTLTTKVIGSQEALAIGLIDELSATPDASLKVFFQKTKRINPITIKKMKHYFCEMWFINEQMENLAITSLQETFKSDLVQNNIHNFVTRQVLPWEN